jgi:uncharacterized membrane protein YkgB
MNKKCVEECKFSKDEVKNAIGETIGNWIKSVLCVILVITTIIVVSFLIFAPKTYFNSNDVIPLLRFGSIIGTAAIAIVAGAWILPDKKD